MTDIDNDNTNDIRDADAAINGVSDAPRVAHRRGVFGRLYHGETAIDFYG